MVIKVTFDTNVFTRLIELPESSDKMYYKTILKAIESETIKGYFSDTFVTLEGVMKNQRPEIFGSRKISSYASSDNPHTINLNIGASMLKPNLAQYHIITVESLFKLGLRGLRGPAYLGDNFIIPIDIDIYEPTTLDDLIKVRDIMANIEVAIAKKNIETGENVGKCRAIDLGLNWLRREQRNGEIWYQGLALRRDKKEHDKVVKAIAEWADAESIIRHIGYGFDYFCTSDMGNSVKNTSIFDDKHRKWLEDKFMVKFVTPKELANVVHKI
jgi:hypothetical protein